MVVDQTSNGVGPGDQFDPLSANDPREELRDLIKAAFDAARTSGKDNWSMMTVAVLKNRLLDLTKKQFSELDYGANSISDLVRQMPELVELDRSFQPPMVKLLEGNRAVVRRVDVPPRRIRQDLWDAIMNYRLGEPYVWDGNHAVPRSSQSGEVEDCPVLPTLTEDDETEWRRQFVESFSEGPLDEESRVRLQNWAEGHLGVRALPESLRARWNDELKARVVSRLRTWFDENRIPVPTDLAAGSTKETRRVVSPVEELRALVIKCVQRMTLQELSELRLPPQALLRGQR